VGYVGLQKSSPQIFCPNFTLLKSAKGFRMAKRRNQKKEKALRNQAYARKFRKRTNVGRFGRRRYGSGNAQDGDDMEQENNREGAEATDPQ
jgi:hypothetical protein